MKRRKLMIRKFSVVSILLGIFVAAQVVLSPFTFAQDTTHPMIDFLVEEGDSASVGFDFSNPDWTSNQADTQQKETYGSYVKELDLGFLGKMALRADNMIRLPERVDLTDTQYSAQASFRLQYEPEKGQFPPFIQIDIEAGILNEKENLAQLEITFDGLLLKGLPAYLSKTTEAKDELEEKGITFLPDPKNDSKATLRKVIPVPPEKQELFHEMKALNEKLLTLQQELQALASEQKAESEEWVHLKEQMKTAADAKSKLLVQLLDHIEFPCAPEFHQVISFPIYEKSGSTDSNNISAKAAIGVSGDVQISISNPTCGLSVKSLFSNETWTYADIDITSHGYFGARTEADLHRDFGVTFTDKRGRSYPVPVEFSEEEQQILNEIVLKTLKKAQDSEDVLRAFEEKIYARVEQIHEIIFKELIGTGTDPSKMCALLSSLGVRTSGSREEKMCQTLAAGLSPKPLPLSLPQLILPPSPPLPPRPDGECKAQIPCKKVTIEHVCCDKWTGVMCVPCGGSTKQEIPPGCGLTNDAYKQTCKQIQQWEKEIDRIKKQSKQQNRKITAEWEKQVKAIQKKNEEMLEKWRKQAAEFAQYQLLLPVKVQKSVNERVFRSLDTRATTRKVAQKLLNAAWEAKEWIDLTDEFLQDNRPSTSAITIKGSARVALTSTAYILNVTPKVKTALAFDIQQGGQPSFMIEVSGIQNTQPPEESGIGGLDVLGYTLSADLVASLAGAKEFKIGKVTAKNLTQTVGRGKIQVSNEEKTLVQGAYRYCTDCELPAPRKCTKQGTDAGVAMWKRFKNEKGAALCEEPVDITSLLQKQVSGKQDSACEDAFAQAFSQYVQKQVSQLAKECRKRPSPTFMTDLAAPNLPPQRKQIVAQPQQEAEYDELVIALQAFKAGQPVILDQALLTRLHVPPEKIARLKAMQRQVTETEQENQRLADQIDQLRQTLHTVQVDAEHQVLEAQEDLNRQWEKDKSALERDLEKRQTQLSREQNDQIQTTLNRVEKLTKQADTDIRTYKKNDFLDHKLAKKAGVEEALILRYDQAKEDAALAKKEAEQARKQAEAMEKTYQAEEQTGQRQVSKAQDDVQQQLKSRQEQIDAQYAKQEREFRAETKRQVDAIRQKIASVRKQIEYERAAPQREALIDALVTVAGAVLEEKQRRKEEKKANPTADSDDDEFVISSPTADSDEYTTEWLSPAAYQREFDHQVKRGFYPRKVEGKELPISDEIKYRATFTKFPGRNFSFYSYTGMSKNTFRRKNAEYTSQGYKLIWDQSFENWAGELIYQATWIKY